MSNGVSALIEVMKKLRNPAGGCPWDLEQDHRSLARYMLEEAYEVVEAIEANDLNHLCEELGDVLLQVIFHAQIAAENGAFTIDDVGQREADKMIERHPHVFGQVDAATAKDVLKNWEADKAQKRAAEAEAQNRAHSVLDGVNTALPAVSRGLKLQQRAARVGFDWGNPADIIAKIREETDELQAELSVADKTSNKAKIEDELGDVFFALVNLARHLDIDPERALRGTNQKFERRFRGIESALAAKGRSVHDATLDEMEEIWVQIKKAEK